MTDSKLIAHPRLIEKIEDKGRLIVRRTLGLGDTIFALAAVHAFKQQCPQVQVWFEASKERQEWVEWSDDVETSARAPRSNCVLIDLDKLPTDVSMARYLVMARHLGVEGESLHIPWSIPEDEQAVLREWLGRPEDLTLLAPWCVARLVTRSIPSAAIRRFIHHHNGPVALLHHIRVPEYDDLGALNLTGETPSGTLIALCCLAKACVGVDAGPVYVAASADKPTTIAYTHIDPRARISPADTNVSAVVPSVDCFPCGDFADPNNPPCEGERGRCALSVQGDWLLARQSEPIPLTVLPGSDDECDVLFVLPFMAAGGGERQFLTLAGALKRRGYDVRAVVLQKDQGHLQEEFRAFLSRSPLGLDDRAAVKPVQREIERLRPYAVVFHHSDVAARAIAMSNYKPRRVVMIKHTIWDTDGELASRPHVKAVVTDYVCVSQRNAQHLALFDLDTAKIRVIRNAIERNIFHGEDSARCALVIPDSVFLVGHIGRICESKGSVLVAEALGAVRGTPELGRCWGLIVGWGDEVDHVMRAIRKAEMETMVQVVGATPRVGPYYKAIDLLMLPTSAEGGIPLAAMEAMACGVPVAMPPVADMAKHFVDSESYIQVPRELAPLTRKLEWALRHRDLLREIGARGREVLFAMGDTDDMAGEYEQVLGLRESRTE